MYNSGFNILVLDSDYAVEREYEVGRRLGGSSWEEVDESHGLIWSKCSAYSHEVSKWKEEQNIVLHKKCIKVGCHNEIYFCGC